MSWLNDKNVTKYSNQRFKRHSILGQKKFIKEKIKQKNSILFKIFYNKNFVGIIELGNIDPKNQNCEIMYFIGDKFYWSKGITTEAIRLSINHSKKLRLKKIYAGVHINNKQSIRVLKKNNFKVEGKISNFFNFIEHGKKNRVDKIILGLNL